MVEVPQITNMVVNLPDTLEYSGEFGPELVLFLPFCYWLSHAGLLRDRRIITYNGMKCFYDNLDCKEFIEKRDARRYVAAAERPTWLPVKSEHNFDTWSKSPFHFYPNLRKKFSDLETKTVADQNDKPLVIIHNKYNDEWSLGPINFISASCLDAVFKLLTGVFRVIYIRHGAKADQTGFVSDTSIKLPFDDLDVVSSNPDVVLFDDLYGIHMENGGKLDINSFKNAIYSKCYHFLTSQGGGAHQIAMYSGSFMGILHRRGSEEAWAYGDGYYSFLADTPPLRAICRTETELLRAAALFLGSTVSGDRVLVDPSAKHQLEALSPWTLTKRARS